ncbi:MAG: hypothetical protein ABIV36_19305 [Sphingobium limneticum]
MAAFDSDVPPAESAMWAAMSAKQRSQTLRRLSVILNFDGEGTQRAAEEAASAAGVSLTRWYEIHAGWKEGRSLAALGTFATSPRTRKLSHHEELQHLVAGVVEAASTASVRQHALALGEAYTRKTGLSGQDMPSHNTLRKFVEAERRRRVQKAMPGAEVVLDCCACELPHSSETFAAFLVIDKGSRIVLGTWLGDPRDSELGYALAASDTQDRIAVPPLCNLGWADTLKESGIVIGLDTDWREKLAEQLQDAGLTGQLKPATEARRFGVFIRKLIGPRMGRVKFVPGQTTKADGYMEAGIDDMIRFHAEVDAHNAALVEAFSVADLRDPPAGLMAVLRRLTNTTPA